MDFNALLSELAKNRRKARLQLSRKDICVLTYLYNSNRAFVADELWMELKKQGTEISLGSVYYSLKKFVDEKVVLKKEGGRQVIYLLNDFCQSATREADMK